MTETMMVSKSLLDRLRAAFKRYEDIVFISHIRMEPEAVEFLYAAN